MSYNVFTIPHFDKELKRLSKKYHSLKLEIIELGQLLENNPQIGDEISSHCYKIRLSIASKGKGKRGGARVITYVYISGKKVFLLSIYVKSEKNDIPDKELKDLIRSLDLE